ncbi:hypothetical protein Tco_0922228 [Tanacetum coccineum]|uniref:Reverse transcriptase domain-containing protein n=1 Tax=Tanacetum coccineum TaxID=301880 RepID=A0ABQ5D4R0_9ASTR
MKCYSDDPLVVPIDGLHIGAKLQIVEEPVEIMDREVKRLKQIRFPIVKVRWNSRRGPEFIWEREDRFQKKYPHLFTNRASSSNATSLSLEDKAHLTGGDYNTPCFRVIERYSVMSSSSTVTYTSVYTDSEPRRVFWGADEELSDGGSPRVIVYRYDGLPMQPVAPPSPDYVPGPEHPLSPIYVPGPKHLPSPVEVPCIPEPEYPEYLVPSDAEAPLEDQPLPTDASPTTLSLGYMADSDPEEDPEEDHADYPTDGGDGDEEPSDDDDDDDDDIDDKDEEPFEEEEEHLALADSSVVPVVDLVPSAGDTEVFKTDESAPTPRSPQTKVPFAQTRLRRVRKTVILKPSMSPSMEARIAEYTAAPTPPSPPPSLLLPWEDIPKAELPPRKRLCPTAPTSRYEVEESLTATPRPTGGHRSDYRFIGTIDAEIRRQRAEEVGYGIRDVWVDPTEAVEEVAPMTLERVNARVTELAAVQE